MSSLTRRSSSSSRIRETWRSVLSWMRWSQRRQVRRELQAATEERQRLALQAQQREMFRSLLWEMALPLMDALTRLDKRILASQMQGVEYNLLLQEMVMEVLQGQQPPVSQQLGSLIQLSSPPNSAS